jgi:vancomycin resistance protein YoaR
MDATVSWGGPDLKFRNDTGHPVLIRATAEGGTMIVNLYSAHSDRVVENRVSERHYIVQPQKRYLLDEYAPSGQIIKYSNGQVGFSVDVVRTVTEGGNLISERAFTSNYVPEHETYIVGPDTQLPPGAWVEAPPPGWNSPFAADA